MDLYKSKELKVKAIEYNRQNYPEIAEYFKDRNHIVFLMERRMDGDLHIKVGDSPSVLIHVGDYILHEVGSIGDVVVMSSTEFHRHYHGSLRADDNVRKPVVTTDTISGN